MALNCSLGQVFGFLQKKIKIKNETVDTCISTAQAVAFSQNC